VGRGGGRGGREAWGIERGGEGGKGVCGKGRWRCKEEGKGGIGNDKRGGQKEEGEYEPRGAILKQGR